MDNDIISSGQSDIPLATKIPVTTDELREEQKEQDDFKDLVALSKSRAWQKVRQVFLKRIDAYDKLDGVSIDLDNERYGAEARVHKAVASELKSFMRSIDEVSEAEK